MKRTNLGNRSDYCAFTVFFCLMAMMFLFQPAAQAQEQGRDQNPLLNWKENGRNPDDFEVLSLLLSGEAAIEVDDSDGHTWTKTFIVPVTANATLTVVATPQPDTTEENLPDEWTLTGGTGTGKLSRTVPLSAPGKFVLHCKCGKSEKETTIYVFSMTFVTPAGDPTTSAGAKDSGDGQNEFTFDSASPGVLTMNLKASVTPASAAKSVASKVSFEVASIGNAAPVYSQVSSDNRGFVSATATVTGLPELNSAFGLKTAYLKFNGNAVQANPYEVFFPKTATNHPTCSSCNNCPNWFYYWKEGSVCGIPDSAVFDHQTEYFGWCDPSNDSIIRLGNIAANENSGSEIYTNDEGTTSVTVTGSGKGIQCVAETCAHENNHIYLRGMLEGNDTDCDNISDINEPTLQEIVTKVNDPDTYNMASREGYSGYASYGDEEIRCRKAELNVTNYNPRLDWANPGCQNKNQFGPNP